jgi:hypothetical protein
MTEGEVKELFNEQIVVEGDVHLLMANGGSFGLMGS